MPRVATERPAQNRQRLKLGHAAAGLVGQRDDTIDVRKRCQRIVAGERILLEHIGDEACDMCAAIHRGENADVIACRDAPVRTANALKRRGQIEVRCRLDVDAVRVILGKFPHADVLHMDMLTRRDRNSGEANNLTVALDGLTDCDRLHCNFVTGRNAFGRGDALRHLGARQQRRPRNHHAVIGMQADHGCRGHGYRPCWLWLVRPSWPGLSQPSTSYFIQSHHPTRLAFGYPPSPSRGGIGASGKRLCFLIPPPCGEGRREAPGWG